MMGKEKITHQDQLTGKKLRKIIQQSVLIFRFLKKITKKEISKNNSARDKQLIFLMVSEGEKNGFILR